MKLLKRPRRHRRHQGFTLTEILVATALVGGLAATIAQLLTYANEGQRRMWQLINLTDLFSIVEQSMRTPAGCQNTLAAKVIPETTPGAPPAGTLVTAIKDANNNVAISSGGMFGSGGGQLKVLDFQLFSTTPNQANISKQAWLRINYQKMASDNSFGTTIYRKDIPLNVLPSATSPAVANVVRCYVEDYAQSACQALGGALDPGSGLCNQIDLSSVPGATLKLPVASQFCLSGNCMTTLSAQYCPLPGQPATCTTVIGIAPGGRVACGSSAPLAPPCP